MEHEPRPLYILPATFVPDKDVIRFRRLDGNFLDSHKHHELTWKILELAKGRLTTSELAERLADAFPELDQNVITAAIKQLTAAGILVDSIDVFSTFHRYTNNPALFAGRLTPEQAVRHLNSPRLAVQKGPAKKVRPLKESALATLLENRRTTRSFRNTPITLKEIGHILTAGYSIPLRSTPSAGALYPLKIFVIVPRSSKTVKAGYYEYNPETHELVLFHDSIEANHVMYSLNDEPLLGNASAIIIIAGDSKRNQLKYSGRGYRLLLLEAGQAIQNMQLAATEQQLGCLEYGGFHDEGMSRLLSLNQSDDQRVLPLIALGIGKPAAPHKTQHTTTALIQELKHELLGEENAFETMGTTDLKDFWMRYTFIRAGQSDGDHVYIAGGTAPSTDGATLKALAEAYERHVSGAVRIDLEATPDSLTANKKRWLDPRVVAPLTKDHFGKKGPMQAFTNTSVVQWTKGTALRDTSPVWVPIDLVYYPLHAHTWGRKAFAWSSSSGVAAYTDKKTATRKALLELLERHCLMTLWHSQKRPKVIPTHLLPTYWKEQVGLLKKQKRNVHVLDISSGYGEVTVKVVIESDAVYPHYTNGAASSLISFEDALDKAFQEARLTTETVLHSQPEVALTPEDVKTVAGHGEFYAHADHKSKMTWVWQGERVTRPPKPTVTIEELINLLDPVAIELSPPKAPLYVVRVICETLMPIGFGFGNTHHLHASQTSVHPDSLSLPHDFA